VPMLAAPLKPVAHAQANGTGERRYERKPDGLRCLAVRNADRVELRPRRQRSFTARVSEVTAALVWLRAPRAFALSRAPRQDVCSRLLEAVENMEHMPGSVGLPDQGGSVNLTSPLATIVRKAG
jgi:hypothetical protein